MNQVPEGCNRWRRTNELKHNPDNILILQVGSNKTLISDASPVLEGVVLPFMMFIGAVGGWGVFSLV